MEYLLCRHVHEVQRCSSCLVVLAIFFLDSRDVLRVPLIIQYLIAEAGLLEYLLHIVELILVPWIYLETTNKVVATISLCNTNAN
jgi:hypothetical protein